MEEGHPLMLVGASGSGKTALLNEKLNSLSEDFSVCNVSCNYYTSSGKLKKFNQTK